MSPNQTRLQYLFSQFYNDAATPDEVREFWELFAVSDKNDPVRKDIFKLWHTLDALSQPKKEDWEITLQQIHERAAEWENQGRTVPLHRRIWRITAAAVIIFIFSTAVYYSLTSKKLAMVKTPPQQQLFKNDVPPGANGATLTLANGKQIVLDSAGNGTLATQGNAMVVNRHGQISYLKGNKIQTGNDVLYNTMTTARGRQYRLVLADGTAVWLNAASSIRYPTAFTGTERKVEITGEAYLEVAKDLHRPFSVTANGTKIQVLGTHFNVNAYEDELVTTTTLLEGSVKVSNKNATVMLTPGQQSQVRGASYIQVIRDANVDAAVAWRSGYFSFDNTDIESVMRQLARWYDIDVQYEGNRIPADRFWGDLQRNASLSNILKVLEKSGVQFSIDGRKIVVLNKH